MVFDLLVNIHFTLQSNIYTKTHRHIKLKVSLNNLLLWVMHANIFWSIHLKNAGYNPIKWSHNQLVFVNHNLKNPVMGTQPGVELEWRSCNISLNGWHSGQDVRLRRVSSKSLGKNGSGGSSKYKDPSFYRKGNWGSRRCDLQAPVSWLQVQDSSVYGSLSPVTFLLI